MKRLPFERPEVHYEERLLEVDEQICALLKKRKELSNDNPGLPKEDIISEWANRYGFYEEFLHVVFETLRSEKHFQPSVEPEGFRKHIPIQKAVEINNVLYTVNFIRQYSNASVINLNIDWDASGELEEVHVHTFWDLQIGEGYNCRTEGGSGSGSHMSYRFVVSPPLPDELKGLTLQFKDYQTPHREAPARLEFKMEL
ncbi:hypothetical protein [Bacillus sinesaloumensis]|uniref:hypothetical protein n=1 Tax=Litchfieldia sinesaloumensis TaxID=1926280 RepID=UPI000988676E|nr:hypothetical protein [Bacillus sinesaloumensis]